MIDTQTKKEAENEFHTVVSEALAELGKAEHFTVVEIETLAAKIKSKL